MYTKEKIKQAPGRNCVSIQKAWIGGLGMLAGRIVNLRPHILDPIHLRLLWDFNFLEPSIASTISLSLPDFFIVYKKWESLPTAVMS